MLVLINKRCDLSVKDTSVRIHHRNPNLKRNWSLNHSFIKKVFHESKSLSHDRQVQLFCHYNLWLFYFGHFFKNIFQKSKWWNRNKNKKWKVPQKNHPSASSKSTHYWKVMGNLSDIKPMQRRLMQVTLLLIGANDLRSIKYDLYEKIYDHYSAKVSSPSDLSARILKNCDLEVIRSENLFTIFYILNF